MINILEILSCVTKLDEEKLIQALHLFCKNGDIRNALSLIKLDANIINRSFQGFNKSNNNTPLKVAISGEKKRGVLR